MIVREQLASGEILGFLSAMHLGPEFILISLLCVVLICATVFGNPPEMPIFLTPILYFVTGISFFLAADFFRALLLAVAPPPVLDDLASIGSFLAAGFF